jgi:hypothetical protein
VLDPDTNIAVLMIELTTMGVVWTSMQYPLGVLGVVTGSVQLKLIAVFDPPTTTPVA